MEGERERKDRREGWRGRERERKGTKADPAYDRKEPKYI